MSKIFMLFMYFMNMLFINFNNPLIMGILLFFQTLNLVLIMGMIYYSFWFSFIIFLVFIGGLFILFVYMISLTYNSKYFYLNYKHMILSLSFLFFLMLMTNKLLFMKTEETKKILFSKENIINMLKFYNFPNNFINILLIIYLLILMIIVVKITNFYKGPIKINKIN